MRPFLTLLLAVALCAAAEQPAFTTTESIQKETRATAMLLERLHITRRAMSTIDMREVLLTYCENLDRMKMYFTQAEVDEFVERYAKSLDLYMERGNLTPAFEIYALFSRKAEERGRLVKEALSRPIDLAREGTFPADRRKAGWPKSDVEADDLWVRRLQFDLLGELLGDDKSGAKDPAAKEQNSRPDLSAAKVAEAVERLRKRYEKAHSYLRLEQHEVEEAFLNAYTQQYDPHSTFMSGQTLEEFEIAMRNSLCGIGATLSDEDGYCVIKDILPGGPLDQSGKAKPGDKIIAVSQGDGAPEDIVGMRLDRAITRIRGKQGTTVRLTLDKAAGGRETIALKRDQIKLVGQLASARFFEMPAGKDFVSVGVVDLPSFYGKNPDGTGSSPTADVEELIGKLKKMGMQALIMDLRRNGGGLLTEAVDLSGLFIPKGSVLQVRDSQGRQEDYRDENEKVAWDGPLIVLTSKRSASASEIFAGAMHDHRRAIVVGDQTTHGKGSVQNIIELSRFDRKLKSAVKVTIQKWYAPSGSSIQLKGVPADIVVPSVWSVLPNAESDLERPLPWDSVKPSLTEPDLGPWLKAKVSDDLIAQLAAASERRRAELPEFLTQGRLIEWTRSRQERQELPISLEARQREKADDAAFREQVRKELSSYAASRSIKISEVKVEAALEQEKKDAASPYGKNRKGKGRDPLSDDEEWPDYDVQLNEAVRIATDWTTRLGGATVAAAPDARKKPVEAK
ncbi:MAG: carboxy terminal-processing peptidase [Opitutales bacterium]